MDEPLLRVWMQEPVPPRRALRRPRPDAGWPSRRGRPRAIELASAATRRARARAPASRPRRDRRYAHETHGADAGNWCPYGAAADLPPDQREEDGSPLLPSTRTRSLERLELLGARGRGARAERRPAAGTRRRPALRRGSRRLVAAGLPRRPQPDAPRRSTSIPNRVPPGERPTVRVELDAVGQARARRPPAAALALPGYWPGSGRRPRPSSSTLDTAARAASSSRCAPSAPSRSRRRSATPRRGPRSRSWRFRARCVPASAARATSPPGAASCASSATTRPSASSRAASRSST